MNFKKIYFTILTFALIVLKIFSDTTTYGSTSLEISGGSPSDPNYKIISFPMSQDSVFSGTISSVDDANNKVIFDTEKNITGDICFPFFAAGSFKTDVQIPKLSVSLTSGDNQTVSTISAVYYGGFSTAKSGFVEPPQVILEHAECNESALVSSVIDANGEITSITIDNPGIDYKNTPKAKIIAGPHFLRISGQEHPHYGRIFLITDNNKTALTLQLINLKGGESKTEALSNFLWQGTLIEVIPANTLGNIFGVDFNELPTNWSKGKGDESDWIYLWDVEHAGYMPYFFLDNSFESSGWGRGWYSKDSPVLGAVNNTIIYPDQSILICKRTSGDINFIFHGESKDIDKSFYLPESENQALVKNPYGAKLLLSELIPSDYITKVIGQNDAKLFRAHENSDSLDGDYVSFLDGGIWKTFWYDASFGNSEVSESHFLGVRRPLSINGENQTSFDENDFRIASGLVSDMRSCDENGSIINIGNESNYTRFDIISANSDLVGFMVEFKNLQGHLLYDEGIYEVNATTGNQVSNLGDGSIVDSALNTHFRILLSGDVNASHDFIVIEKQRDINFRRDLGNPMWNIGKLGVGYNTAAKFYCVGGNNGTYDINASGSILQDGTINVDISGTGYTKPPKVITSGGGWRLSTSTISRDNFIIGATEGILIQRNSLNGVRSYIKNRNPSL